VQEPRVEAVHTDVQHIDQNGDIIRGAAHIENALRASIPYDTLSRNALMEQLFLKISIRLGSTVVLRRPLEEIGGFDETLFGGEDWEFWVRFAAHGHRIAHIGKPLTQRRIHTRNVSSVYSWERSQGLLQCLDTVSAAYPSLGPLASRRSVRVLRTEVLRALREGNGATIRSKITEMINLEPRDCRTYVLWLLSFSGPLQGRLANTYVRCSGWVFAMKTSLAFLREPTSQH
jgi:hypothetical protein